MHPLFLLSVWLHILAASTWIGGMFFLVLVVVPWLRHGGREQAGSFLRETGPRFRTVSWACLGLLLVTGLFNAWVRGVRLSDFVGAEGLSPYHKILSWKVGVFVAVLLVSSIHDFVIGPRATRAIVRDPVSATTIGLRRNASLLGRLNALLALVLVALAVTLVRGLPW
ncbi:MAG: DUF4149 domain-containing protein [Polyangiaceae bacterium]